MTLTIFTPGRTELAGNHTDHQNGRILASAVDMGLYAAVEKNDDGVITIASEGFEPFSVKLTSLSVLPKEFGTPKSLTRGMAASFKDYGLNVGGFTASVKSTLAAGSGLSSSAAFSVMIGRILNVLYNNNEVDAVSIARSAQYAENEFFGKPCGLMDQLACSLGHAVYVDFKTMEIDPIVADFGAMGLKLSLTDTGGSHAGLDTSYGRIRQDMVYIANLFSKGVLADVDEKDFFAKGWSVADRPVRRAKHFFEENARVPLMRDALKSRDADAYIRLMNESGRSSETQLNNIVTSATGDTKLQEGLELSASLLEGKGAWRVHGGGFAGCVQALMPADFFDEYKSSMEARFGAGSCREIKLV